MENKPKYLSEEEVSLICQIVSDDQSGNHLLRERPPKYWAIRKELSDARYNIKIHEASRRDKEMVELYKQSDDYDYYHSLDESKRLI